MTDQLPSKDQRFDFLVDGAMLKWDCLAGNGEREATSAEVIMWAEIERLQHKLDTCGLECSATLKSLVAENEELRRELVRTESARKAILGENAHYKRDAARWRFFRNHHMSDYQGKRLHVWLVDNMLRADGIDAAMDEVMSVCSAQPPGDSHE